MQNKYPNYATIGKLTRFYFIGRGLHNRHTQFPNKQRKEKGVATSLLALAHCWPLVSLVSRRPVFSAGTCPPSARVLSAHTPTTNCALGAAGSLSSTSSRLSLRRHVFSSAHTDSLSPRTQTSIRRRFPTLSHSLSPSPSSSLSLSLALCPLLGRRILSPPIGGGHASFPRHRDRWVFTPGEIAAVCFSCCTQPP